MAFQIAAGDVAYIGVPNVDGWAAVYAGGDTVGFVMASILRAGYPQGEDGLPQTASRSRSGAVDLRVSAFNMVEAPVRGKTEVWLRGHGSWFPDLTYGGDVTTFEGRTLGAVDSLHFYPLGRVGPVLIVPIELDSDLCSQGCVRDMVNFEIWPERFVAWGSPIEGHEFELKR